MPRKSGLQIQQEILSFLSEKECSLRELETKLNTNYNTIRAHCRMLAFYGFLELIEHKRNKTNGKPFTTAKITEKGLGLRKNPKLAQK